MVHAFQVMSTAPGDTNALAICLCRFRFRYLMHMDAYLLLYCWFTMVLYWFLAVTDAFIPTQQKDWV
jgi:hypothetical protein